jgi:hypothetical protein
LSVLAELLAQKIRRMSALLQTVVTVNILRLMVQPARPLVVKAARGFNRILLLLLLRLMAAMVAWEEEQLRAGAL